MAHVKGAGTTSLGRDSQAQRLGVKLHAGEIAKIGSIIVRQRGTHYFAGKNVKRAHDDSLFSLIHGQVAFKKKKVKRFDGRLRLKTCIEVLPIKK